MSLDTIVLRIIREESVPSKELSRLGGTFLSDKAKTKCKRKGKGKIALKIQAVIRQQAHHLELAKEGKAVAGKSPLRFVKKNPEIRDRLTKAIEKAVKKVFGEKETDKASTKDEERENPLATEFKKEIMDSFKRVDSEGRLMELDADTEELAKKFIDSGLSSYEKKIDKALAKDEGRENPLVTEFKKGIMDSFKKVDSEGRLMELDADTEELVKKIIDSGLSS